MVCGPLQVAARALAPEGCLEPRPSEVGTVCADTPLGEPPGPGAFSGGLG